MPRKKYLVVGRSRGTGPRATVRGGFLLWSDGREGQALALRCARDFCLCLDDREGQALALRCAEDFCLCSGSREGLAVRQHRDREVSPTLCSDDGEGQALALRCARDFCLWSDAREGQALALRCAGNSRDARDFLLKNSKKFDKLGFLWYNSY